MRASKLLPLDFARKLFHGLPGGLHMRINRQHLPHGLECGGLVAGLPEDDRQPLNGLEMVRVQRQDTAKLTDRVLIILAEEMHRGELIDPSA